MYDYCIRYIFCKYFRALGLGGDICNGLYLNNFCDVFISINSHIQSTLPKSNPLGLNKKLRLRENST